MAAGDLRDLTPEEQEILDGKARKGGTGSMRDLTPEEAKALAGTAAAAGVPGVEFNRESVIDAAKQVATLPSRLPGMAMRFPAEIANLLAPAAGYAGSAIADVASSYDQAANQQAMRDLTAGNSLSRYEERYLPQPKTPLGEYARTASDMAGQAATMPGKILANLGIGAASGVASEGAGRYARENDPANEALYRGIAPLVVGGVSALKPNRDARKAASRLVPSLDDLGDASKANRATAAATSATLDPSKVSKGIGNIRKGLQYRNDATPEFQNFDNLLAGKQSDFAPLPQRPALDPRPQPPAKAPVTLDDIDNLRKQLGGIAQSSPNSNVRTAARAAKEQIDDLVSSQNALTGNATEAARQLRLARANEAAKFRAENVAGRIETGELNAASQASMRNADTTGKQALKTLIKPKKGSLRTEAKMAGMDPAEIKQLERVVYGTTLGNIAQKLGTNTLTHGALGAGGATMALTTGNPLWLLPAVGSYSAKKLSGAMTKKQERILDELVRSRSPAAYENMRRVTAPPRRLNAGTTGGILGLRGATYPPLLQADELEGED
jgi:hypothetical protein